MTRFLIALIAILVGPSVLAAQTVRVLGGEHAEFTRLTFQIPATVAWSLKENDVGFTISLSDSVEGFDLSRAFDRIPKRRVLKISPSSDKTALEVALGCDCSIETFQAGPNLLAVDLTGEPDDRGLMQVRETFQKDVPLPQRSLSFGALPIVSATVPDFHIAPSAPVPALPPIQIREATLQSQQEKREDEYKNRLRVAEVEKQLLEQIGRAASQGLLKPNGQLSRRTNVIPPEQNGSNEEDEIQNVDMPATHDPSHVLMHAENAMQSALQNLQRAAPEAADGGSCIKDEMLDVAAWGSDEQTFGEQISVSRAALFGEFDRLDPKAARSLVKSYLYFGFGVEAAHIFSLIGPSDPEEDAILLSISRIMDQGFDDNPGPFIGQMSCDTHAALWSILAERNLRRGANFEEAAVLRAFSSLPEHLKVSLGPILNAKLLDAGSRGTAEKILRILDRSEEGKTTKAKMVEAEIHIHDGRLEEASDVLETVVVTNSELSPEALIKMIDSDIARGYEILPETVDLISSYVFEYQDSAISSELKRILVRGKASARQYEEALKDLEEFNTLPARRGLLIELLEKISTEKEDVKFLRLALSIPEDYRSELPASLGNDFSERLLQMGFPSVAAEYAKFAADGSEGRVRRTIRAKIAMVENRPRRAEADLLGLTGPDIDKLRAEARAMTGDFNSAKKVFSAAGMSEEEMEAAWLAGDWQSARLSENETVSRAAEMILQGQSERDAQEELSIEENRNLLNESKGSRETIRALLGEMEFDDAMAQIE